jgi:hypothetical protein
MDPFAASGHGMDAASTTRVRVKSLSRMRVPEDPRFLSTSVRRPGLNKLFIEPVAVAKAKTRPPDADRPTQPRRRRWWLRLGRGRSRWPMDGAIKATVGTEIRSDGDGCEAIGSRLSAVGGRRTGVKGRSHVRETDGSIHSGRPRISTASVWTGRG